MNDFKVTPMEMANFLIKFNKDGFPHQRLGQAFCNQFDYDDPELFYRVDRKNAEEYIWLFLIG